MFVLPDSTDLSKYLERKQGAFARNKMSEQNLFFCQDELWLYMIHKNQLIRAAFSYSERGDMVDLGKFKKFKVVDTLPVTPAEYEPKFLEEQIKVFKMFSSELEKLDHLIPVEYPDAFGERPKGKTQIVVKSGIYYCWRPGMSIAPFRTELAAVAFGSGMNIRLCDKLDSIPKDSQKAVFKQLVSSDQSYRKLLRLRILWMEDIMKSLNSSSNKADEKEDKAGEMVVKDKEGKEKAKGKSTGNDEAEMAQAFSVRDR
ncbi:hypothetical protein [Faecalibaculum rodentium]|uniref:hypothetical protein n=2 Tax=Erysipelotrichaceae TaxID=128827 RepID=UPI00272A1FC3|nr:hypothetical protein [Faecalibaculum rodentium]